MKEEQKPVSVTEALLRDGEVAVARPFIWFTGVLVVFFSVFHLYTATFTMLPALAQYLTTSTLVVVLTFIFRPLGRTSWNARLKGWSCLDILAILVAIGCQVYVLLDFWEIVEFRATDTPTTTDIIVGTLYTLLVLEAIRRSLGYVIFSICAFLILQNIFSQYMPGIFYGPPVPWDLWIQSSFMQLNLLFSVPTALVSEFLVIVLLFASVLQVSGAGDMFTRFAIALVGKFQGGPAKVAVVSSALVASIQGQAMSNVVTTGSFTIPLMKKVGYDPRFAGAVEAVASSAGIVAPPIMGASAFIASSFLEMEYYKVAAAATFPVLVFYVTLLATVHFRARKMNLGVIEERGESVLSILKTLWVYLIPIVILVYLLFTGHSISFCFLFCLAGLFILCFLRKETRLSSIDVLRVFEGTAKLGIIVGTACLAASIITGVFYLSGLGPKLTGAVVVLSGGNLFLALVLTAIVCLILGMGMPTIAVYVTVAVTLAPALIKLGALPLAAHLFCLFLGSLSAVTPPVALASFAAAGISGASPMRTAAQSARLALPLYLMPFCFIFAPKLLLIGKTYEVIGAILLALIGGVSLAAGFENWLMKRIGFLGSSALLIGGTCLLVASYNYILAAGIIPIAIVFIISLIREN
jgi:TRAP transporter 4TM/12TM fusion protein